MSMRIIKALTLPDVLVPNATYLISDGVEHFKMFVTTSDGTSARRIANTEDILSQTVLVSDTAPDATVPQMLWWDSVSATLFVKFNHGNGVDWMEAMPSLTIPDFAGNGTATTVSRSDHFHTTITVLSPQW